MLSQHASGPRQPRHYRSNWDVERVCNLLIFQFFQVSQDDYFLKDHRKCGDGLLHQLTISAAHQRQFRSVMTGD